MGCDLHSFTETYNQDSGKWERVYMYYEDKYVPGRMIEVEPYTGRDYTLFGVLAGVRGMSADPIVSPRGIPKDVSNGVRIKWEEEEEWCHTPTWLSLAELRLAAKDKKRYSKEERQSLKPLIDGVDFMVDATQHWAEDSEVRVVLWFDS